MYLKKVILMENLYFFMSTLNVMYFRSKICILTLGVLYLDAAGLACLRGFYVQLAHMVIHNGCKASFAHKFLEKKSGLSVNLLYSLWFK